MHDGSADGMGLTTVQADVPGCSELQAKRRVHFPRPGSLRPASPKGRPQLIVITKNTKPPGAKMFSLGRYTGLCSIGPTSTRHIPKTPAADGRDVPFVQIELSQTVVVI